MRLTARLLSCLLPAVLLMTLLGAPASSSAAAPADTPERAFAAGAGAEVRAPARNCANGRPSRVVRDPVGDNRRGADAHGLALFNKRRDRCFWFTALGRFSAARAQVFTVWIDTDSRYDGFEYQAWTFSPQDRNPRRGTTLRRYYRDADGEISAVDVRCRTFSSFLLRRGQLRLGIPKACLGAPDRISIRAAVVDVLRFRKHRGYFGYHDWIPQRRSTPYF